MEAKSVVIEKEAGENKDNLKVPEEVKELLDKKDQKQKVANKAKTKSKQKAVHKEKKVADVSFRDAFANKAVEQIKGLIRVDTDDKILLKFKRNTVARLMVRTNSRMCAYRKGLNNERLTMRVNDDKDETTLMEWIVERVEFLKSKPVKVKEPKPKKQKKEPKSKVPTIQKLENAESRAYIQKGSGFSLRSIKVKPTAEVKDWISEHNYKLEANETVKF